MYRVQLSLRSQQQAGDESPEVIEQKFEAWLTTVAEGIILSYDEAIDEAHEQAQDQAATETQTELYISPDSVTLKRKGAQSMEMFFKSGQTHELLYDTPYGRLPLKIRTQHIAMSELGNSEGSCSLHYELSFEGQPMLKHQLEVAWLPTVEKKGESHD